MSGTDAHRPLHALYADPAMRKHFKEFHHHTRRDEHGALICDIELAREALSSDRYLRTECVIQWWSHLRICGCRLCTGHDDRRQLRRRERHTARGAAREAAGRLDHDDPATGRPNRYEH